MTVFLISNVALGKIQLPDLSVHAAVEDVTVHTPFVPDLHRALPDHACSSVSRLRLGAKRP